MAIKKIALAKIRDLRQHGYSIPEISQACGIPRSTVLRHVKEIGILPQYYQRWEERRNASKILSQRHWDHASKKAEERLPQLTKNELIMAAALLYWAEGSKRDFSFSNTDPEMIRVFISIIRGCLGVSDDKFKISLRIYDDLDRHECIKFWGKITGINLGETTSIEVLKGKKTENSDMGCAG